MKQIYLFIIMAMFILGACSNSPDFSESVYKASEAGVAKKVVRCRVISVRQVVIRDEKDDSGSFIGSLAGGLLGTALGSTAGGGSGTTVTTTLGGVGGALLGGAIGDQINEAGRNRQGLEYSVLKADGEEITFAQEFSSGDRILNPGDTCRLQVSGDINRVLPADHLPEDVARPKETTFSD